MGNRKEGLSEAVTPDQPTLELMILGEIIKKARSFTPLDIEKNMQVAYEIEELTGDLRREIFQKKLGKEAKTKDIKYKAFIPTWRKKMKQRKWAYFFYLKNKRMSEIYMEWYNSEDTILPNQLIPKTTKENLEEELPIKFKLAKEKMKYEAEIMSIRSRNYSRQFQNIDSEMEDKILIRTLDNHHIRKYLLDSWKDESKAEEKRSMNIWKLKEEFILSKSYKYDDSYGKEGTMLQKRGKNENHIGQPKKRKGNCSRRKAEKQDNSYSEPMVEKENYSLYQSRHKIEREYLQEMDDGRDLLISVQ